MNDEAQNNDNLVEQLKKAEEMNKETEHLAEPSEPAIDPKDAKIEELTHALARTMADLQNFKRRSEEDRGKFARFAGSEVLKAILPTIDNLHRSVLHLPEELKTNEWAKGVVQIHDEALKTLEKLGVKKMQTIGEKLNPLLHEALMSGPGESDIITEEFESGYLYNDEVLKVAKVKVGDGSIS